jgi:NitT/TauT family transport system substrate-binding protein
MVNGQTIEDSGSYPSVVLAAAAGDQKAFTELVYRFQGMAAAMAGRWFDDRGLVEDAVQEAFLAAFTNLHRLRNAQAFPAWFRKILHNCCNRLKRKQVQLILDSGGVLENLPATAPDPYEQMVRYQTREMVATALNTLEGVAREACIQRYILGLPYKEIATALQVPEGTIKRRLHDVRTKIIRAFQIDDEPVIRVGYLPISDHILAMASHCINRGRLKIQLKKFLSWSSLATFLENDLLDAAFVMAPIAMALHNKGVPIVYVLDGHHDGSAITVHKDMTIGRWLTENRVGLPYAISTHRILFTDVLGNYRETHPLAVKTRYLGPSYLLNSLISGEIDAFCCAEPWNTKAVIEGAGTILARSKDLLPGHICCIVVVREAYLEKHGDRVRRYLRLLLATSEYLTADFDRSAKIQERYTGVSADIIKHALQNHEITFNEIRPDRGRIETMMRLAMRTGLLDAPCDIDRFLCNRIL